MNPETSITITAPSETPQTQINAVSRALAFALCLAKSSLKFVNKASDSLNSVEVCSSLMLKSVKELCSETELLCKVFN